MNDFEEVSKLTKQALETPGCERLRDWVGIGPVQRAALELFLSEVLGGLNTAQQDHITVFLNQLEHAKRNGLEWEWTNSFFDHYNSEEPNPGILDAVYNATYEWDL